MDQAEFDIKIHDNEVELVKMLLNIIRNAMRIKLEVERTWTFEWICILYSIIHLNIHQSLTQMKFMTIITWNFSILYVKAVYNSITM